MVNMFKLASINVYLWTLLERYRALRPLRANLAWRAGLHAMMSARGMTQHFQNHERDFTSQHLDSFFVYTVTENCVNLKTKLFLKTSCRKDHN
jgi:hypothetical protein